MPPERRPLTTPRFHPVASRAALFLGAALAGQARGRPTSWSGIGAPMAGATLRIAAEATSVDGQVAVKIGSLATRRPLDKNGSFTIGVALGRDDRVGHLRGTIAPRGLVLRPDGGEVACNGTLQATAPAPVPTAPPQAIAAAPAPGPVPSPPGRPPQPAPAMIALAAPSLPLASSRVDDITALRNANVTARTGTAQGVGEAKGRTARPSVPASWRDALRHWSLGATSRPRPIFAALRHARSGNTRRTRPHGTGITWVALFRTGDVARALAQLRQSAGDLRGDRCARRRRLPPVVAFGGQEGS
jgi:hypothetical protein